MLDFTRMASPLTLLDMVLGRSNCLKEAYDLVPPLCKVFVTRNGGGTQWIVKYVFINIEIVNGIL